ncbi:AAA domain-containing protein [Endozoicomonas sp. ONNA1]|uniref:AAA domain-containing protein n=1 Tax=Endozoicomonas sp. ONNA1 TaxID=2828740 RepID=UPI0021480B37|nr:AAA domain-containing protein [Endozoicomonas sp. ONNA1]
MDVVLWHEGLQQQEIAAIEKIQKRFQPAKAGKQKSKGQSGSSMAQQLGAQLGIPQDSMFPWKGYAGFRFTDSKGKDGEFDLVIITHCNILIIELKDWNHGKITANRGKWYKNDQEMGNSPVDVTQRKLYLLQNKLKKYKNKLSSGHLPKIHHLVVMTGDADFSQLPETDLQHTLTLDEFLSYKDRNKFNKRFRPHPEAELRNDAAVFDQIFSEGNTAPKHIYINGYKAVEHVFKHPAEIYKEFRSILEQRKEEEALLRVWDFNKIENKAAKTPEGRQHIVSRERDVLSLIKHQKPELYNYCLRALPGSSYEGNIPSEYCELYELPPSHQRLNEFIGRFSEPLSESDRFSIVKLLVAKFADLHEIKVAHRDIGSHSIWISPSRDIALSSFISAYDQRAGTVGDIRELISVSEAKAPFGMTVQPTTTPFQIDVHALIVLSWHILEGRRISPESLKGLDEKIENSATWYKDIFLDGLRHQRFKDAGEFFSSLKENEPHDTSEFDFDISELDVFQKPFKVERQYPEDQLLKESDSKEVYRSDNQLVKAWLNVHPSSNDPEQGYRSLHFCKALTSLKSLSPDYLPEIHDFGLSARSGSLFLVTDYVEGDTWETAATSYTDEQKKLLIESLISATTHLHGLSLYHGDLHPENLLITNPEYPQVKFLDLPDFSVFGKESFNHLYSPENIDGCSGQERDNFAVMRMTCYLLGIGWNQDSEAYPKISTAVRREIEDIDAGFRSLERFIEALKPDNNELNEDIEVIEIRLRNLSEEIIIYPDNGQLFVSVERSKKNPDEARVRFIGLGGSADLIYSPRESGFVVGFQPRSRDSVSRKDADSSDITLPFAIRIISGHFYELSELNRRISEFDEFKRVVNTKLRPEKEPEAISPMEVEATGEFAEIFASVLVDIEEQAALSVTPDTTDSEDISFQTSELWKAVLDTETMALPYIEVSGDVFVPENNSSKLALPYTPEVSEGLEKFRKGDDVEALTINEEHEDSWLGDVDLKKSSISEVHLKKISHRAKALTDGDIVYFRTKMDRSSYQKRKNALKRILDRSSVIPNLTEYFDPECQLQAIEYPIEITDQDFTRYDRPDDHGNTISLNPQQRLAFRKLVRYGPLSLLQGPPGTGKTEFIAAFVHFLVEKEKVNSILLVSQSHEAVNTAAERIRKHCRRLDTPLEVVRFSNRESTVSDSLKDVYAGSIVNVKRELFRVEASHKIMSMSKVLGVEKDYLKDLTQAEFKLFSKMDTLKALDNQSADDDDDQDQVKNLTRARKELIASITESLREDFSISWNTEDSVEDVKSKIYQKLEYQFDLQPNETLKAKALVKIYRDMLDALAMDRVNYDEFLARSRQLVTGTCVGIGQRHMGIGEQQYDWVIIDEAARSISSELAIAMQVGKRILLVGDHKQLPPMYSKPHQKAIAKKLGVTAAAEDLDGILKSDFERAFESEYGKQVQAQLLTQYRMIEPIGRMVSDCFYEGKLVTGERVVPDIYHLAPQTLQYPVTWLDTAGLKSQAYHNEDKGVSIYNRTEADQIISLLREIERNTDFLAELGQHLKEGEAGIGVICMYGEQKRFIRQRFNETSWSDDFKNIVKIDTVDSYQGKENRIIILSITRADGRQSPGFLHSPNRINVALSRAMDRLVIVGSTSMWRGKNKEMPFGRVLNHMESAGTEYRVFKAKGKGQQRRSK